MSAWKGACGWMSSITMQFVFVNDFEGLINDLLENGSHYFEVYFADHIPWRKKNLQSELQINFNRPVIFFELFYNLESLIPFRFRSHDLLVWMIIWRVKTVASEHPKTNSCECHCRRLFSFSSSSWGRFDRASLAEMSDVALIKPVRLSTSHRPWK